LRVIFTAVGVEAKDIRLQTAALFRGSPHDRANRYVESPIIMNEKTATIHQLFQYESREMGNIKMTKGGGSLALSGSGKAKA